jgi:hypothetical protein
MQQLRKSVEASVKQGRKLGDLVAMKDGKPESTTVKLPESVKKWIGPSLPTQVRDAFEEITAGKPHGDLPH